VLGSRPVLPRFWLGVEKRAKWTSAGMPINLYLHSFQLNRGFPILAHRLPLAIVQLVYWRQR
jgi:hypothetical protein